MALVFVFGLIAFPAPALAAGSADVAGAVTSAYNSYVQPQIKSLVNGVIFPIISILLAAILVAKIAVSAYSYKHNGNQFEWHVAFGLFCGLIVSLTAKLWIWNVIK